MASAKLVDLALTKSEQKDEATEAQAPQPSKYPWGLTLRLEKEELDKLGIKKMPAAGGEWHFEAVADVTSVSEQQMASGDYDCCVQLQIKMMGVELEESADDEKVEKDSPAEEEAETRSSVMSKYRGAR